MTKDADEDAIYFDHYEPDYTNQCENCGQTPVVTAVDEDGNIVHSTGMCGPCTWGTSKALNPDWWNTSPEDD